MITQSRLKALFTYDEVTGRLHRIVCEKQGHKTVTGGVSTQGYFVRWVDDVCYLEHVLVYLWHTGEFVEELDHWNRIKTDNRIGNLRPCDRTLNNANQSKRCDNSSGYRGVSAKKSKWVAQITVRGTWTYLGLHATADDAARAYNQAAQEHFGEFAHINEVPC